MISKTITVNGVTLTVQRHTGRSVLHRDLISDKLRGKGLDVVELYYYTRAATQTSAIDGLDWDFPTPTADDAAHVEALEQFMSLDGDVWEAWALALDEVNRTLALPEERHGEGLSEDERADPNSESAA